jgi:hypothetical protein
VSSFFEIKSDVVREQKWRQCVLISEQKTAEDAGVGKTTMTNPNSQTNGASLEDCHTNFFSLVSVVYVCKTCVEARVANNKSQVALQNMVTHSLPDRCANEGLQVMCQNYL